MSDELEQNNPDLFVFLAQYLEGPVRLQGALAGLADSTLDTSIDAQSWSIRQIVHHIVDGDDLWKACIKMALGGGEPVFHLKWYWDLPQTEWAERWNYAGRDLEPSLALFSASRNHIVQLVSAVPDAMNKSILVQWPHSAGEVVTVRWLISMQSHHVSEHIEEILKIRSAVEATGR